MGLLYDAVIGGLKLLPRPLMRSLASRYIAGETLDEALAVIRDREAQGYRTILDILGENVTQESEARDVAAKYIEAARALAGASTSAYVSVKPTHVGLTNSEDLAFELYLEIGRAAAEVGAFLRVEMEDHPTTDGTLRVYERLRDELDNVGIVLQARLHRTLDDIRALREGPIDVRIVKGIYLEPEEIAHVAAQPIRDAFIECTRALFERGATVSIATHDAPMADQILDMVRTMEVPGDRYEFQVLMGVQESLWRRWREAGHTVRVYVPYGPEWKAYSLRRLSKNPQIFRHIVRDTLSFRR